MAVPVATKKWDSGDVFIRESMHREYDASSLTVTNNNSSLSWVMAAGQPMLANVPVIAASIATLDGLLLEEATLPPLAVRVLAIIDKMPGLVVNGSALPTVDHLGAAIVMATFKASLRTLNAKVYDEPTKVEAQTT